MKFFTSIILSVALLLGVGFLSQQAHAQVANGCFTTAGYSITTGVSCNGVTTIPLGCTSTAGFNSSTGQPCNGATAAMNGYNGTIATSANYLNGCSSINGYSGTTGYPCNMAINGVVYNGYPVVTPPPVVVTDPGLPTTGAGQHALINFAVLLAAATAACFGVRALARGTVH
jgi:hypothetical protein